MTAGQAALVLLPGFLCDRTVWEEQIAALSGVAACTCAEYGRLDSLAAMAQSVLRAAPERFAMAGHSMGGRIALEVFRQAPSRVTRIALFNTGARARPAGPAGAEEEHKRRALLAVARSEGMRAMALQWIPGMVAPDRLADGPLVEAIARMFERKTPDIFEAQMNALLGRPDATGLLGQIRCPALLLSGREDSWSGPAAHQEMAASMPNSRLVVVPECGHMSTMEQPAAVAAAMHAWLLGMPAAA